MKNVTTLIAIILIFSCCSKDEERVKTESEKLTLATQTGANTFSCLLDGQIFKPGETNNSYQCFYQYVNGEYYFLVTANNSSNGVSKGIFIGTEKKTIAQGQSLNLTERLNGNSWGAYFLGSVPFTTNSINFGELKITKLSYNPNIVSGTFWFDVKDNQNVVHQIREGRFDMQFTQ